VKRILKNQAADSVKNSIIKYVAAKYATSGKVPSMGKIIREFRVYKVKLYKIFPEGIGEICRLANVPTPEDRVAMVRDAQVSRAIILGDQGKIEHSNELQIRKKAPEEQEPKDRYDNELAAHRKSVQDLSYRARVDNAYVLDYLQNRFHMINPELFQKIELIFSPKRDLGTIVADAFGNYTYLDFQKSAMDRGEKETEPSFDEWVSQRMTNWFESAVFWGKFKDSNPGSLSGRCPSCGLTLTFMAISSDGYQVCCEACKQFVNYECRICGSRTKFFPPDLLCCSKCRYPQKFTIPLWHAITKDYLYWAWENGFKDPRLIGWGMAMLKQLPDGTEVVVPGTYVSVGREIFAGRKPWWTRDHSLPP